MGTPTPKGAGVKAELSRKARVSQEWLWVSRWGGASVGASPRVSRGGEASDRASPWGKQGTFRDGETSVWASPCEFR